MLQFNVDHAKCVKCKKCVTDCPMRVISMGSSFPFIDEAKKKDCIKCQHCLAICPVAAISILGKTPENSLKIKNGFPEFSKMEILAKGRRSIRYFKNENIDRETIDKLLGTALHAPTAHNDMQVHFWIIDDKEKMKAFARKAMDALAKESKEGRLTGDFEFFNGIAKIWIDYKIDIVFRNAPHMVISSTPKECTVGHIDSVIALSYLDILAPTLNIGTLWCGLAKWVIEHIEPSLRNDLGIPENHDTGYIMLLGKPDVSYFRTVQRDPKISRLDPKI